MVSFLGFRRLDLDDTALQVHLGHLVELVHGDLEEAEKLGRRSRFCRKRLAESKDQLLNALLLLWLQMLLDAPPRIRALHDATDFVEFAALVH